jgi:viroplasmin and RNaseH domain-containing protein
MITINLDKAKEIQKNRWRTARKPILEKLDTEFMRAVETGDTTKQQQIATQKQTLRDVTTTDLSTITNTQELKNVWPNILNES